MPEYRWGIFLADQETDRVIPGGDDAGKPVWNSVPGEHRNALKRLIVTQADTEPGSVEQQRWLANTAPSLYDARNLFQVNVEEGRHLWAMVYLLQAYFGRDGGRKKQMNFWNDDRAMRTSLAFWMLSINHAVTGLLSSVLRPLRIVMASINLVHWQNLLLTPFPELVALCLLKRHITSRLVKVVWNAYCDVLHNLANSIPTEVQEAKEGSIWIPSNAM